MKLKGDGTPGWAEQGQGRDMVHEPISSTAPGSGAASPRKDFTRTELLKVLLVFCCKTLGKDMVGGRSGKLWSALCKNGHGGGLMQRAVGKEKPDSS